MQNTCRPDAYQFCAVQTIRRLYAHIAQNKSVSIKMSQHVRRGPVGPFFEAKVAMLWPPRRGGVFRGRSGCGRRTPGGRRRSVPGRRIRARRPRGRTVGCGRRTPGGRGRSAGLNPGRWLVIVRTTAAASAGVRSTPSRTLCQARAVYNMHGHNLNATASFHRSYPALSISTSSLPSSPLLLPSLSLSQPRGRLGRALLKTRRILPAE